MIANLFKSQWPNVKKTVIKIIHKARNLSRNINVKDTDFVILSLIKILKTELIILPYMAKSRTFRILLVRMFCCG